MKRFSLAMCTFFWFLTQMYARFWGGLADPGVGLTAGISQKPPGFRGFCS